MQCECTETPCPRLCLFLRVAIKCNSHRWWTRCHKIPQTRMLWYNFACEICMLCDTMVSPHIICIVPISLSVFWRRQWFYSLLCSAKMSISSSIMHIGDFYITERELWDAHLKSHTKISSVWRWTLVSAGNSRTHWSLMPSSHEPKGVKYKIMSNGGLKNSILHPSLSHELLLIYFFTSSVKADHE